MIPVSIEILHDLENHEHTVCTSIGEHHIHKQNVNCDEFHKHLTIFSMDFTSNFDVIPTHFYANTFIDKPQVFKEIYHDRKFSRGPPSFTA
ncbi:hypothetical protein MC378_02255 [Polaribacter sp. MSW13]|uniref:Uncharacterized protein n=1 Tax=Polaribacter marinus TaxID=2916838 RepID=A0A9X1VL08_9FLAO|nr:hypothetical protein [Polaribacter marinus]MCI2227973.1 hypothetical protein [Polaribacter marinus]